MLSTTSTPAVTLRSVMRPTPPLSREDSLGRFVRLCRQHSLRCIPVLHHGKVAGFVTEADVLACLPTISFEEKDKALRQQVADFLSPPPFVITPDMPWEAVAALFAAHDMEMMDCAPVVDADGYCLGIVAYHDLLVPDAPAMRPGTVGGMATPFGVYLTDGAIQAGAGDWAIVASGVFTGVLLQIAFQSVDFATNWAHRRFHVPLPGNLLDISDTPTHAPVRLVALSVLIKIVFYAVFFLLMRMSLIAGYHAAEHQTVHAMERGEPLVPDIVARMPRPHPRCGTNIVAIPLVLFTLWPLLGCVPGLETGDAFILSCLVTFFLWRRVGTFLQAHFTTRTASARQLASGIAAGQDLIDKYYNHHPVRPTLLRRIWCMGFLQNLAGMALVLSLVEVASWLLAHFRR